MSHVLVLEGKPQSKKNGWAIGRGRMYQKKTGLAPYVQALRLQAAFQMRRLGLCKIAAPEGVALRFRVFFGPRQHAMDTHNAIETVLDALQGICYDDDIQVVGQWWPPIRLIDKDKPRVEVELQTAEAARHDPRWAYGS